MGADPNRRAQWLAVAVDPMATHRSLLHFDAIGAASLFLGGTRSPGNNRGDATILTVGADEVTLANDAAHALKGGEIILAAKNTLTLKSGSAIETQGNGAGGSGSYTTIGNGALVRAASTYATFSRTDSPDRTQGTLTGETGSVIRARNSITLDATKQNTFAGTPIFADHGKIRSPET